MGFNPFKSIGKVAKGITKPFKKILRSPIGKAAMLYAGYHFGPMAFKGANPNALSGLGGWQKVLTAKAPWLYSEGAAPIQESTGILSKVAGFAKKHPYITAGAAAMGAGAIGDDVLEEKKTVIDTSGHEGYLNSRKMFVDEWTEWLIDQGHDEVTARAMAEKELFAKAEGGIVGLAQGGRIGLRSGSRQPGMEHSVNKQARDQITRDVRNLQSQMEGTGGRAQDYVNVYADPSTHPGTTGPDIKPPRETLHKKFVHPTRQVLYNLFPNNPKNELRYIEHLYKNNPNVYGRLPAELRNIWESTQEFGSPPSQWDKDYKDFDKFSFDNFESLRTFDPGEGAIDFADYAAEYGGAPALKYSGNVGGLEKYVKTRDEFGKPLTYGYTEKTGDGGGSPSEWQRLGYPSQAAYQAAMGGGGAGGGTGSTEGDYYGFKEWEDWEGSPTTPLFGDTTTYQGLLSKGGRIGLYAGGMGAMNNPMNPMMNRGLGAMGSPGMNPYNQQNLMHQAQMRGPGGPQGRPPMPGGPTTAQGPGITGTQAAAKIAEKEQDTDLLKLIRMLASLGIPMEQLRGRTKEELVEMVISIKSRTQPDGREEVVEEEQEEIMTAAHGGRVHAETGGLGEEIQAVSSEPMGPQAEYEEYRIQQIDLGEPVLSFDDWYNMEYKASEVGAAKGGRVGMDEGSGWITKKLNDFEIRMKVAELMEKGLRPTRDMVSSDNDYNRLVKDFELVEYYNTPEGEKDLAGKRLRDFETKIEAAEEGGIRSDRVFDREAKGYRHPEELVVQKYKDSGLRDERLQQLKDEYEWSPSAGPEQEWDDGSYFPESMYKKLPEQFNLSRENIYIPEAGPRGGRARPQLNETIEDVEYSAAKGGGLMRTKYAMGTEQPIIPSKDGAQIDYRGIGGYQPHGKKEKHDDVRALLAQGEFVVTSDAVKGIGDGDRDLGAKRMYDMMHKYEPIGRALS